APGTAEHLWATNSPSISATQVEPAGQSASVLQSLPPPLAAEVLTWSPPAPPAPEDVVPPTESPVVLHPATSTDNIAPRHARCDIDLPVGRPTKGQLAGSPAKIKLGLARITADYIGADGTRLPVPANKAQCCWNDIGPLRQTVESERARHSSTC